MHSVLRRRLPVAAAVIMLAAGAGATAARPAEPATAARAAAPHATFKPPRIKHVWVILLENESFGFTFGAGGKKQAPFLAKTLPSRGALLTQYFGVGHHSLDNYIALASGPGAGHPDRQGLQDVQRLHGRADGAVHRHDQPRPGPRRRLRLTPPRSGPSATSWSGKGLTWKAYEQQMGVNPARDGTTSTIARPGLRPPAGGLGRPDPGPAPRERQLRGPARPVRVLPLGDRQPVVLQRARGLADPAGREPRAHRDHPELLLHHPGTPAPTGTTRRARTAR